MADEIDEEVIHERSEDAPFLVSVAKDNTGRLRDVACVNLQNFAVRGEQERDQVVAAGAVDVMVAVMGEDGDTAQGAACAVIMALCMDKTKRQQLCNTPNLLTNLSTSLNSTDPKTLENASGCLRNLATVKENKRTMCSFEVVKSISTALVSRNTRSRDVCPRARENLCGCLWGVTAVEENQVKIATEMSFVLESLVGAVGSASGNTDACQEAALQGLCNIARSSEGRVKIKQTVGAILTLVDSVVDTNGMSPSARKAAAKALFELASHKQGDTQNQAIVNAADSLVGCLVTETEQSVRQPVCGIMYELSISSPAELLEVSELATAMGKVMESADDTDAAKQFASGVWYNVCSDETLLSTVVDSGILTVLLKIMTDSTQGDNVVMFACGTIYMVATDLTLADKLVVDFDVIDPLVDVVKNRGDKVQQFAAGSLHHLSLSNNNKQKLTNNEQLIQTLITTTTTTTTQQQQQQQQQPLLEKTREYCSSTLVELCYCEDVKVKQVLLLFEGLLECAVELAKSDNENLQQDGSGMLLGLISCQSEQKLIMKRLVPQLIELLETGNPAAETAAIVLYNTSMQQENKEQLVKKHKTIPKVVKFLQKGDREKETVALESAAGILISLAYTDDAKKKMFLEGAVAVLLALLPRLEDGKLLTNVCGAICAIASCKANRRTMVHAVQPCVNTINKSQDETIRTYACGAVQYLTNVDESKAEIANMDGVLDTLANLAHDEQGTLRDHSTGALCDLAFSEDNAVLMVDSGCLDALLHVIADNKSDARAYACGAVWGLSIVVDNRSVMVDSYNVAQVLSEMIKSSLSETDSTPAVKEGETDPNRHFHYSCLALQNLASVEENHPALYQSNTADTLINLCNQTTNKTSRLARQALRYFPLSDHQQNRLEPSSAAAGSAGAGGGGVGQTEEEEVDPLIAQEMFRHCTNVMKEMEATEGLYVKSVKLMLEVYEKPLLKLKKAKQLKVASLFKDVPIIIETHSKLHSRIVKILEASDRRDWPLEIANTISDMCPDLKECSPFIDNFDHVMATLDIVTKDKNGKKALEEANKKTNLNLQAYLIMPVQRIPRIELLLKDLIKHTSPKAEAYGKLSQAIEDIKGVALHFNETKKHSDQLFKMSVIALKIRPMPQGLVIQAKGRELLEEGRVRHVATGGLRLLPANMYLFNDLLIWAGDANVYTGNMPYRGHANFKKGKVKIVEDVTQEIFQKLVGTGPKRGKNFDLSLAFYVEAEKKRHVFFGKSEQDKKDWIQKFKAVV